MTPIELRDYQLRAAEDISVEGWKKGLPKVLLVLPTGAGKTTVACEIVRRTVANSRRVLFLAHRRRLIQQIAERMGQFGVPYTVEMADLPPDDPWVRHDPHAPVVIASRDTLLSRAIRNGWSGLPAADLLFVDEAHRLEGAEYAALADKCRIKHRVGLTATPCRGDGSGLGRNNWDVIVETANVRGLTAQGHLVPVKCFSPREMGQKRKRGEKTPAMAGDPVEHWKQFAEGKRTVAFTTTVAEATAVRDRFRAAGIPAEVVSARTPHAEREDIIGRIKDGRVLWCGNANVMTEGVDVPELEVCQILCKCDSYIRYIQAVGRVLRPAAWTGKTGAILLDHSGVVFQHGFPDEPVEWKLEEEDDLHARVKQDKKDGKRADPVLCVKCGALFAGCPACPECGAVPARREKRKKPEASREKLVQVSAEADPYQQLRRQQREWKTILNICKAKGWSGRRASAMFKTKFGQYPESAGVEPAWGYDEGEKPVQTLLDEFYAATA